MYKVTKTIVDNDRSYRGFNFFDEDDQTWFETLARGEFNVGGMRNRDRRRFLPDKTCGQILMILKRLRAHGLLKRAGPTYKYYLTKLGRLVLSAVLRLKELFLVRQFAAATA